MLVRVKRKQEEWRPVSGKLRYEVSNRGNVRYSKDCTPVPEAYRGGYLRAGGSYVHTFILLAFHGPKPFPKAQCRHLDGCKLNNRPDNLRWGTHKENTEDRRLHGTLYPSDEHKKKMAAGRIGNKNRLGIPHSLEVRTEMSRIRKSKPGKPHSEETKRRLAEAARERWKRGECSPEFYRGVKNA